MRILVAGTPGVGKTTFSSEVSKEFGMSHVEVSAYIEQNKLYTEFDKKYATLLFDEDLVGSSLERYLSAMDSYVVDTHSCEVVKTLSFDLIFVLTTPIEVLYKRLRSRGYGEVKIKENIECEIFGVVREEVEEIFGMNFYVVGEENDAITLDSAMDLIRRRINDGKHIQ